MALQIEGFPELSDYIELPTKDELLLNPIMTYADPDDVYKYGGEVGRFLLSKTPIKNDRKYVSIVMQMQYLTEEFCSIRSEVIPKNDWHVDGSGLDCNDVTYLLLNDTDVNTEFNAKPILFEGWSPESNQQKFIEHVNEKEVEIGLEPIMLQGNRMATFGVRHLHRSTTAKRPTLRFMWRVTESNFLAPKKFDPNANRVSHVYKYKRPFENIVQTKEGIRIYL